MRDWFEVLRSGNKRIFCVPGVLGVLGGKISLKIACWRSGPSEHRVDVDVCGCGNPCASENGSTPATPGELDGVPLFCMEKAMDINILGDLEHSEHQEHHKMPEREAAEQELAPMVSADQLSPAERAQFCLDHELTLPEDRCPNKNKMRGCLLWQAILERRLVRRPRVPDW